MDTKACTKCQVEQPLTNYYKVKQGGSTYLNSWCKTCIKADRSCRRLGITTLAWWYMRFSQGDLCDICHRPERKRSALSIDHDHKTGQVRALLCTNCNIGLGHFEDDPALLRAAADYIEYHSARVPVYT